MKNNKKVKKSKVSKDKKSKPKKSFDGKMILRVNATSLAFAILSFIILVAFTVVTAWMLANCHVEYQTQNESPLSEAYFISFLMAILVIISISSTFLGFSIVHLRSLRSTYIDKKHFRINQTILAMWAMILIFAIYWLITFVLFMVDIIPLLDPNNTQPALKNLLGLGGTTYSPETEAAFFDISYIVTFGLSSLFSATLIGLISANIDKSRFAKHTSRK